MLVVMGWCPLVMMAQRTARVCGETDYVVPETQSQTEAKRTAITRARLQALADEFGTVVSQTNTTAMHNVDGKSESTFNSYSENEVRGVWVEDTKEPEIKMSYVNGMLVIHASVCGKAREIKTSTTELAIQTMNYGNHPGEHPTGRGEETTSFRNEDFFGVQFKSPVKGYVALFLRDDPTDMVYTLMPYDGSDGYAREVKSNMLYSFLTNKDPEYPKGMPSTILTADKTIVHNTLIVVFSETKFSISLSEKGAFFPEMDNSRFQKWLHSLRTNDETMQVREEVLTIKK